MTGYTKLFNSIVTSTMWEESPVVCKVWITMLALADRGGIVEGSVPGLAHFARVSVDQVEKALTKFMAPDKYSRSHENKGRRIEAVDGGWRLLNHAKYKFKMSKEDIREQNRIRQQRRREQQKGCHAQSVTERDTCDTSRSSLHTDTDTKEESYAGGFDDDFDGSEWALTTFKAYPKWGDPDATVAPARLSDVYMETIERETPSRGGRLKAAEWFLKVTREFARQSADKDPKFVMQLEKFLRQGYAEVKLPRAIGGKQIPKESDEELSERLRKEARERQPLAKGTQ